MTRCRALIIYVKALPAFIVPVMVFLLLAMLPEVHREHQRCEQEVCKTLYELKPSADCESTTPHDI